MVKLARMGGLAEDNLTDVRAARHERIDDDDEQVDAIATHTMADAPTDTCPIDEAVDKVRLLVLKTYSFTRFQVRHRVAELESRAVAVKNKRIRTPGRMASWSYGAGSSSSSWSWSAPGTTRKR